MDNPFLIFGALSIQQLNDFQSTQINVTIARISDDEEIRFGMYHTYWHVDKVTGKRVMIDQLLSEGSTPAEAWINVVD